MVIHDRLTLAVSLTAAVALTASPHALAAPAAVVSAAIAPAAAGDTIGPAKGTLVIVGGGVAGPEIWTRFIDLAGGADKASIVIIPTASGVPDAVQETKTPATLRALGVKRITVLHTTDRSVADSDSFTAPLNAATGVWFDGGRQWHLVDAYAGTKTEKAFDALLARGGVIGGSSAGASIQGSFLVRGDTSGPSIVDGDHKVGFGFLKNSAIDQHILVRNREFDLIPLIERNPDLLGIGINESTAIVVHGNQFEVIGKSYVAITDANQWRTAARRSPNGAAQKGKIYFLGSGQKFDLATRTLIPAAAHAADGPEAADAK